METDASSLAATSHLAEQKGPTEHNPNRRPFSFKHHGTIGIMEVHNPSKASEIAQAHTNTGDWIDRAIQSGRMLSSKEVASMLGYRSRCSFWGWVKKAQPPHVRLSARNIRFPATALKAWLDSKSNSKGVL